ncbi:MAG: MFS transporter [Puniceicoccales bacterium]|jgi:sugar phosphate permease|nr:MFS transporter [Puniceicoccales bacterium]
MKLKHERKNGGLAWLAWAVAALFYLYEYLVRVAPSVMGHELAVEFSASTAALAAACSSYYFVYSPLQLFAGALFDRFGGKAVLIPASILVSAGCLFSIIPAHSLVCITIGRILAGVGSSCAFIGVMYLAAVWFQNNRLSFLSGFATSLGICGALLGEAPLALLIDKTGWKMSMALMAIIGIVVTIIITMGIPQTPRWEQSKRTAISDKLAFKHLLSGLLSVCKNKQTWLIGIVASCLYMPVVAFGDLWGVQYAQISLGITKTHAAKVVSMLYIGWLVGSPLIGLLSDVLKRKKSLLFLGCFFSMILFLVILLCPIKSTFTIGTLLFAAGVCSCPEVICFVASLDVNMSNAKGSAIAVVNMIVMLVGGAFQFIVGWLLDRGEAAHGIAAESFRNALMTMPLLMLIGMILTLFIRLKRKEPEHINFTS